MAFRVRLLTAQSVDETTSQAVDCRGVTALTVYYGGTGTISSGVITIEEATWPRSEQPYGGTWASIGTVNTADVSAGLQKVSRLTVGAYAFVRARISTAVAGGGTVTVDLVGA